MPLKHLTLVQAIIINCHIIDDVGENGGINWQVCDPTADICYFIWLISLRSNESTSKIINKGRIVILGEHY